MDLGMRRWALERGIGEILLSMLCVLQGTPQGCRRDEPFGQSGSDSRESRSIGLLPHSGSGSPGF